MQSVSAFLDMTKKVADFRLKKSWCQQNLRVVPRELGFFFLIFLRWDITVTSFIIVGHVWQILGRGDFFAPSPLSSVSSPEKGPSWIGLMNWQTQAKIRASLAIRYWNAFPLIIVFFNQPSKALNLY